MNKDAMCLNTKCHECPFNNTSFCSFVLNRRRDVEFTLIIDELTKEIENVKRKMKK